MQPGDSNDQTQPLTGRGGGAGDDNASQSSQRSGASLLERIRAQREREAAAAAASQQQQQVATPSTIQVPQYSQVSQQPDSRDPFSAAPPLDNNGSDSGFFQQAWHNISNSMETGMASLQQERGDLEASDALLAPTTNEDDEENYSMIGYFLTFVRDVYETFLNLPLWVRVVVVFALLYTAIKLM